MGRNAKYSSMRRYYKKYYKKRYGKYKFSKYNTFKNRSSVAQAGQIYSLNKKIDRYVKQTKPETQTKSFNAITDSGGDNYTTITSQSTDNMMWVVTPANVFTTFQGKLARIRSISVRGFVSTAYNTGFPTVCRLVFFAAKQQQDGLPLPSEIVTYNSGDNTDYEKGPLKTGVTSNYKILLDKSVIMSPSFYRSRTFKFKLSKFVNFRASTAFKDITVSAIGPQAQIYPTGSIFCLALFSNHSPIVGQQSYAPITLKDFRVKISYIDQN